MQRDELEQLRLRLRELEAENERLRRRVDQLTASVAEEHPLDHMSARLMALIEQSSDFMGIATPDGQAFYVNAAGRRLVGLRDMDEVRSTHVLDYFAPEDRSYVEEVILPVVKREGCWIGEYPFRRFDTGEKVMMHYSQFSIRGAAGEVIGVAAVARDITAAKRSQVVLLQSEERLAAIFAQAAVGLSEVSLDGRFVQVNDELCRLLGRSREEVLRLGIRYVTHPDDTLPSLAAVAQVLETGRPASLDKRYTRPDGTLLWANSSISRLHNAQGQPGNLMAVTVDLTARRVAEEALRESEERFRDIADNVSQLVWTADASGSIYWYNKRWYDYTGTTFEAMQGWGWREVHHPDHIEQVIEEVRGRWARGEAWEGTYLLRSAQGEYRWFLTRAEPIRNDAGELLRWFGTNTDITDRKRWEEHQRLLVDELNHRVKNTLATVQSIATHTLRNVETAQEARTAFEGRLLALSRAHNVLTRESWDAAGLRDIVTEAVEPFADPRKGRIHIEGPDVRLSPRVALALAMGLQELATNAVRYGALSNHTGEVRIAWSLNRSAKPPELHLRWEERGGPQVEVPTRRGFGLRLIERSLGQDLNGEVEVTFAPTGIVCILRALLA